MRDFSSSLSSSSSSENDGLYSSSSSSDDEEEEKKTGTIKANATVGGEKVVEEKKKKIFAIANEKRVCVGCREMDSPCISQGLCLDPTVIELLNDAGRGESLFLIEGQLVRSVGEEWRATSLVYKKSKGEEVEDTE